MAIIAKFTRTLPAPTATIGGGFVFLLSVGWFTQANTGAAGSPIDGGTNSIANGGGDMQIFSDTATTTQLPIEVVTFVTGGSPQCQVWVRTPSYTSGDTITIGKDDTQTTQPAVGAAFGRNATWADFELVIHQGTVTDSAGNHTPVLNGAPSLVAMNWGGNGYLLDALSKYISIPHAAALNIERIYSIDVWLDNVAGVTNQTYVDKVNSGNSTGFRFLAGGTNSIRTRHPNLSAANITGSDSDVAIKRISSDFDNTTRANIKNGVVVNSDTPSGTVTTNTDDLYIGFTPTGPDFFNATLGDFWLSKTSRTVNQKASEQTNQNDPDNFGTSSEYILVGGSGISIAVDSTLPSLSSSLNLSKIDNSFSIDVNSTLPSLSSSLSLTSTDNIFDLSVSSELPSLTSILNLSVVNPGNNTSIISFLPSLVSSLNLTKTDPATGVSINSELPSLISSLSLSVTNPEFDFSVVSILPSLSSSLSLYNGVLGISVGDRNNINIVVKSTNINVITKSRNIEEY